MAAPLPVDEAERLSTLREYRLLDTGPDDVYDGIARLAAFTFGVPIATISFIDAHRQWFKAATGIGVIELPREVAFCAHTILRSGLTIVPDARTDPRFSDNPSVIGGPHVRFYAGAPLIAEDGQALGSLCVVDIIPRHLTLEQEDALLMLARLVEGRMALGKHADDEARLAAQAARAEATSRASGARLEESQRIARVGSWEVEVASQRLIWTTEMYRLYGFDPALKEPAYEAVTARYHPADRAERDRLYARALATGEPYRCDLRLILPDGTRRCCHVVGRPQVDATGAVTRMAGTVQDITDRVEREQRVRDANAVLVAQQARLEAANAELTALVTTDPLTGLLNHRAFQARLSEEGGRAGHSGAAMSLAILDLNGFRYFNDVYGHGVGDAVLRTVAGRLREVLVRGEAVARFGGDEFLVLIPSVGQDVTPADVEDRLRTAMLGLYYRPGGEASAVPITAAVGAALYPWDGLGEQGVGGLSDPASGVQEALRRAEERLWRAKTGGEAETEAGRVRADALRSLSGFSMLDALVTAVDNKDRYTRRHSEDVLDYSMLIARELGMSVAEQRTVGRAALLHDVGKIGVPDAILRKPGRLTAEEFEAVKQHPQMGAIIVQGVPGLEDVLDAVCHHHERWDGEGYPFGLAGTEIPLLARLMAVADAFSAMTTDRPYRRGMEGEEAFTILADGSGIQWDRRCVDALIAALPRDDGSIRGDIGVGY